MGTWSFASKVWANTERERRTVHKVRQGHSRSSAKRELQKPIAGKEIICIGRYIGKEGNFYVTYDIFSVGICIGLFVFIRC